MKRVSWYFFFLPLCLYMGVVGQAGAVYWFAIIFPCIIMRQQLFAADERGLLRLGLYFLAVWSLFPLANVLNVFLAFRSTVEPFASPNLPWKKVFTSQIPSTWLVSAVALIIISRLSRKKPQVERKQNDFVPPEIIWRSVVTGFVVASSLYGLFFLFQHLTGFDFRNDMQVISTDDLMGDGNRYRITGFYGHQLSIAGVTLSLFTFFFAMALAMNDFSGRALLSNIKKFPACTFNSKALLYIALLNFGMLLMSGGRVAILIGMALFFLVPIAKFRKKFAAIAQAVILLTAFFVLAVLAKWTGILSRYNEIFENIVKGDFTDVDRLAFWKVHFRMFLDNPVYGQGASILREYLRKAYYESMGYSGLMHKYNAHNVYLETLADIGIVGFVGITVLIAAIIKVLRSWGEVSRTLKWILLSLCLAFLTNAIHGLTQNIYFDANVMAVYLGLFWVGFWVYVTTLSLEDKRKS